MKGSTDSQEGNHLPEDVSAKLAELKSQGFTKCKLVKLHLREGRISLVDERQYDLNEAIELADGEEWLGIRYMTESDWKSWFPGPPFLTPEEALRALEPKNNFGEQHQASEVKALRKDLKAAVHEQKTEWNALPNTPEVRVWLLLNEAERHFHDKNLELCLWAAIEAGCEIQRAKARPMRETIVRGDQMHKPGGKKKQCPDWIKELAKQLHGEFGRAPTLKEFLDECGEEGAQKTKDGERKVAFSTRRYSTGSYDRAEQTVARSTFEKWLKAPNSKD